MNSTKIMWVIILCLLALFAIYINHDNAAEQIIYSDYHLVLGRSIWNGTDYPASYPLWGYPVFVGLIDRLFFSSRDLLISSIQVSLALLSCLWVVLPKITRFRSILLSPLFFPVFFHAAVKWADAIYVLCLIVLVGAIENYADKKPLKLLIIAGFLSAIASNFRPDFLYLSIFTLIISLILFLISRQKFTFFLKVTGVIFLASFISLIPWFIHSGSFNSTNGGLVFYISLGQLPDNPWGRVYNDHAGFEYAHAMNTEAYSPDGNKLLFQAALRDIKDFPFDYFLKVFHNLKSIFIRGIFGLDIPMFFLLFTILFALVSIRRSQTLPFLFIISVLTFTIIWISMLQYINRHLNCAYTLMLVHITTTLFNPLPQRFDSQRFGIDRPSLQK